MGSPRRIVKQYVFIPVNLDTARDEDILSIPGAGPRTVREFKEYRPWKTKTAGAVSMAAGEYVSVSSQADTEKADLTRERHELATEPNAEEEELAGIYIRRGLEPDLARTVARQLMARDALAAHARDELGLTEALAAKPLQAAFTSAATFAIGAAVPIGTILAAPSTGLVLPVFVVSVLCLGVLGAVAARIGGAPMLVGVTRVTVWGVLAMAATAAVGRLFGTTAG